MELVTVLRQDSFRSALARLAEGSSVGITLRDAEGHVLFSEGCDRGGEGRPGLSRPLEFLGKRVGSLELHPWWQVQAEELRALAHAIGQIVEDRLYTEHEIASLAAELAGRYEEIHLLSRITETLGSVFDVQQVSKIALEFALKAVPAQRASLLVVDETEGTLRIVAQRGIPEEVAQQTRIRPGEGICGWVFEKGEPLLVEDISRLQHLRPAPVPQGRYATNSFLSVPLVATPLQIRGRKMGVLNLADRVDGKPFTTSDLKTLTTIASVTAIALHNCHLVEQAKAAERLRRELEIAKNIQRSLLPKYWPEIPGGQLAGLYLPAQTIGGDYYDFYHDETQLLSMVVADVSGHDIGAALLMIEARSAIRSEMSRWRDPAEILHGTNRALYEDLESGGLFISAFCARLDPSTWTLEYANAGHCWPIWVDGRSGEVRRLDAEGMIIGIWPEVNFEKREVQLQPQDIVLMFTDGVSEAKSPAGEPFGEERLGTLVSTYRQEEPWRLTQILRDALRSFTGNAEFVDDITVVVLKRL
jgi:sigma-B regulation protein RsbU (phosphoserine phosphatase)